jgi:hypothetical protein
MRPLSWVQPSRIDGRRRDGIPREPSVPRNDILREDGILRVTVARIRCGGLIGYDADAQPGHEDTRGLAGEGVEGVVDKKAAVLNEQAGPQSIVREAVERGKPQFVQSSQGLRPPLSLMRCDGEGGTYNLYSQLSVGMQIRCASRAHLLERLLLVVAHIGQQQHVFPHGVLRE